MQPHLRKSDAFEQAWVALATCPRCHGNVVDHVPLHPVAAAFETTGPVFLEPASAQIAIQTDRRGKIDQNEARRLIQSLWQKPGVVSIDDPAMTLDRFTMQPGELVRRPGHPVCMRLMIKLVEVHDRQPTRFRYGNCQGRLAAVGRPHNADSRSENIKLHGAISWVANAVAAIVKRLRAKSNADGRSVPASALRGRTGAQRAARPASCENGTGGQMIIRAPKIVLRDFESADRAPFVAYQMDPRYLRLYDLEADPARADNLFDIFISWRSEYPRRNFQLGVFDANTGRLCGCAGLRVRAEDQATAVLGIELAPSEWGRYRLALDVATLLVRHGFDDLHLQRIIGNTASGNRRVEKLARWFGARIIDRRDGPEWMQARGWQEVDWAITCDEWRHSSWREKSTPRSVRRSSFP